MRRGVRQSRANINTGTTGINSVQCTADHQLYLICPELECKEMPFKQFTKIILHLRNVSQLKGWIKIQTKVQDLLTLCTFDPVRLNNLGCTPKTSERGDQVMMRASRYWEYTQKWLLKMFCTCCCGIIEVHGRHTSKHFPFSSYSQVALDH